MLGCVLLVDDDLDVLKLNAKFLKNQGYSTVYTNNPQNVLDSLSNNNVNHVINMEEIDCIVLDIMMPNIDGFLLCKKIREKYDIPIIFLSGKVDEDDKLNGLIIGADDYITKPYSLKELSARIMVNIRRKNISIKNDNIICYHPLKIDVIEHKAYYNDEEIQLSKREYELLYMLVSKPGEVITFEEIGEKLWGVYTENDRKNVMVNASRLRKKIASYTGLENMIETVWSKGYKFIGKRNKINLC